METVEAEPMMVLHHGSMPAIEATRPLETESMMRAKGIAIIASTIRIPNIPSVHFQNLFIEVSPFSPHMKS